MHKHLALPLTLFTGCALVAVPTTTAANGPAGLVKDTHVFPSGSSSFPDEFVAVGETGFF